MNRSKIQSKSAPPIPTKNNTTKCNTNRTSTVTNAQPQPSSQTTGARCRYLHLAPDATPVTSIDWPTAQPTHSLVSSTAAKQPPTPHSSRSRMMTCRRPFERTSTLYWPLVCEGGRGKSAGGRVSHRRVTPPLSCRVAH